MDVQDILSISHGVAIILLFAYSCYLIFQLISHKVLFEPSNPNIQETAVYSPALARKLHIHRQRTLAVFSPHNDGTNCNKCQRSTRSLEAGPVEDKEVSVPHMNLPITIGLFLIAVVVAITAEALFDSTDDLSGHINMTFVSLILLPNAGNAAEYWDVIDLMVPVEDPVEDNLTVLLGSAMGSSIQIALFVIPFTVILGWILGKHLTLLFDPFESLVLFFSVLTVNYVIQGGKSNWLKGMILICLYAIVAVTLWYYPASDPSGAFVKCT
ncbi:hypothetical protein BJV78DRAFT_790947 [Lactifluus subvellereus]|nr:hypothetical protein BJV78DRAFT_790947 [Lactifluus subvellereus]